MNRVERIRARLESVGIDPYQSDGAVHALDQVEAHPTVGRDVPCGHQVPVVPDRAERRQEHRTELRANLIGVETAVEQPRHELGTLVPGPSVQTIEQP